MNIGITGATGFIGRHIIDRALRRGHECIAFTRQPERAIPGCEMRRFALDHAPDIRGCDAIIHLAGEPVFGLWTRSKKRRIVESRVEGTRRVVEAINSASSKPEVLVSGSAIGFYGDRGEEELTEESIRGSGFLADTTAAWEAEASKAAKVRVVLMRTAIVLGQNAGALQPMKTVFKFGLGGPISTGKQWMSWIHLSDIASLALFAVENMEVRGPLNASAPWPVRNSEFTRSLARALRRPAFFRVPAFALRTALGDFSAELIGSKRVLPAVATELGFRFQFPELAPALSDLIGSSPAA